MKILLSNDDGYLAPGLRVLIDVFAQEHEVIVVAPDSERFQSLYNS
jgi:5'-nucleotidase